MRHIRAAIKFLDLALELGRHRTTRSSPESLFPKSFQKTDPGPWWWSAAIVVEKRGRPGRLKNRKRHGTSDKDEKAVSGTEISIGKFPPRKRDYLFRGRVPFDQNSRFEFPKFSYVEWNGIFHQAGPISFYSRLSTFHTKNDKMLKDRDEVAVLSAVLSCVMWRSLTRIQNSTLPWYLCKPGELTTGNSKRSVHIFSRKSDPNDFVFDQEQARTMADHFASSVVLNKDSPPSCSFPPLKELGPVDTG